MNLEPKHSGKLFILSGPSGAGKGTICKRLLEETELELSISMTTRAPREGEIHGKHYYFDFRKFKFTFLFHNIFLLINYF